MLGIFGGSFDPVHFGHIKTALALLERFNFEQICFVPCRRSPFKQKVYASARHRWRMLNLIVGSNDRLAADDRELRRSGPCYTIDTLKESREETKGHKSLVLIMGMDAYSGFCQWRDYKEILSLCNMMLLQRPGYALAEQGCEKELYDRHAANDIMAISTALNGRIYLSDEKKFDVSSTAIRQAVVAGDQPRYLLPGSVWNYICEHNLYR